MSASSCVGELRPRLVRAGAGGGGKAGKAREWISGDGHRCRWAPRLDVSYARLLCVMLSCPGFYAFLEEILDPRG